MADSYARQGGAAHDVDDERQVHAAPHAELGAPAPIVGAADPRLSHGGSAEGLMALQRSAGNAAVASLVAPRTAARTVQREVQIDEMTTTIGDSDAATAGAGAAGPVTSDGATTTITGGAIHLDAPMTSTGGVLQADTVIANNIVASSYTPGAGNVW